MKAKPIPKSIEQINEKERERRKSIGIVTTSVLKNLVNEFLENKFEWMLPIIFSKTTDPLWPDPGSTIEKRIEVEIYGKLLRANLSMIVHKMVACSLLYPKLFVLSPNIRIERRERANSGIHLFEFTQLDFEMREAEAQDVMKFVEKILRNTISKIKKDVGKELEKLGRKNLKIPGNGFKVYDRVELEKEFGKNWEKFLEEKKPFWVVNIPREFYDFEDENGNWKNYDLFLPGLGEVLSGSKREYEYKKIVGKMERDGVKKENYKTLLDLAKKGKIKPSAGAGIGIERLVSWIVGVKHIGEVQPFPRIPGIINDL
jgi:asparaginyl-tRNA synthetase